ncbi:hypothetical protein AB0G04_43855 [Actinoplanes sp. NPDC023801]|uniref:hypothetical protein n=1 Tax=Actinoplanes sp. NPDC023801 TaxID=3154595 RepID=UPI00340258FE
MVDIAAPLKPYQVEVLRWVEAGCPDADMPGDGAKQTARALQGRRLVAVSRRGGRWSATLTERGRYYLDNGRYPDVPGTATTPSAGLPGASPLQTASTGKSRQPAATPAVVREAAALIEKLQNCGGTLVVPDPDPDTRASYRRAIHAAKQHNLVPDGHDLRHTGRNTGDLVIRLYSAAQPYDTDWNRLRLNQGETRATPPADYGALEQDPTNLRVTPESIPRVIGLLHALDSAGADRKCRVGVNLTTKHPKPYVKFGSARRSLDIVEEHDQVPHVLTVGEQRTKRLRPWAPIPEFDRVATGRLRLDVANGSYTDQRLTWHDTTTKTLEQQAGRIIADIIKAIEKQNRILAAFRQREQERQAAARLAQQQAAEERRRREIETQAQWEHALTKARRLAVEEHRRKTFTTALEQWRTAAEMRAFCDALEHSTATDQAAGDGELTSWLTWARAHADKIDPTIGTPTLASIDFTIRPGPEGLRPHLNGWSPYRPAKE